MINVGFIGAGGIAETHAEALTQVDGARLTAVMDVDRGRAEALASRFGGSAVAGLEELLTFSGLDIVYILTPPHVHTGQILSAVEARLPVFCEKPLTMTLEEADRVIDVARSAGVPLMTGLSHRYHPLACQARTLLSDGKLGDFVAAWSHRLIQLEVSPGTWLSRRELSGGVALQYAMHDLDWMGWLGGEVDQVAAQEYHTNPEIGIEDNLWSLLLFRNGGSGSLGVSWTARDPHTERGLVGSRGNLRIIQQRQMVGQAADGSAIQVDLGANYEWHDVFVRENKDIIQRLARGEPFAISGEDGRRALEISLAVQHAALTRQMVRLPG